MEWIIFELIITLLALLVGAILIYKGKTGIFRANDSYSFFNNISIVICAILALVAWIISLLLK
jgi:multisubunit Na+/H+ antiporter MnhG subunit